MLATDDFIFVIVAVLVLSWIMNLMGHCQKHENVI